MFCITEQRKSGCLEEVFSVSFAKKDESAARGVVMKELRESFVEVPPKKKSRSIFRSSKVEEGELLFKKHISKEQPAKKGLFQSLFGGCKKADQQVEI